MILYSFQEIMKFKNFVRTINHCWFSLGFWGGRLDIDGTLNKKIL